jgi:hypothetical protein
MYKLLLLAALPLLAIQRSTVCASGCDYSNLQTAINAAQTYQDGTSCVTYLLVLTAGETFTGNFDLPAKACARYVRLQSSKLNELPHNTRVVAADATKMAKLIPANNSINSTIQTVAASGTGYWALEGLELSSPAAHTTYQYTLVGLSEAYTGENQISKTPHHIYIDRSWIHGVDGVDGPLRCIGAHGRNIEIRNSRIENCKSTNGDSQAIWMQNTPGPVDVVNNYLEGAGENVLVGGAWPGAMAWITQRGLTFRNNYIYKRRSWKYSSGSGVPTWTPCIDTEQYVNTSGGQGYTCTANVWNTSSATNYHVKNLFELKEGQNVVLEGNVLDGNWWDKQTGTNVLINQSDPVQTNVRGFVMQGNRIYYGQAFLGMGYFGLTSAVFTGQILVEHNLQTDMAGALYGMGGNVSTQTFIFKPETRNRDIWIRHNTVVIPNSGTSYMKNISISTQADGGQSGPVDISDNAFWPGQYVWNRDGYPNNGWCSWRIAMASLGDLRLANNLIVGASGSYTTGDSPGCPSYVDFPTSVVFGTDLATTFTDPSTSDWTMKAAGPGKASASDGLDTGVDFDILTPSIANATAGTWSAYLESGFRRASATTTVASVVYAAPSTTACTLAASTSRTFGSTAGSPSVNQTGRSGTGSVTGLTTNTFYWLRLTCSGEKYFSSVVTR